MSDPTPTLTDEQRDELRYAIGPFSTCDVDALAPLIARMVADAEQRVLREAADELPRLTEGPLRIGTALWPESDRDAYSLAIEEAQVALRTRADEVTP